MNTEVITVATHNEGTFEKIINNKFDINVKVLGYGEKWTGFDMKYTLVYNYIKNLPEDKIIIFIDGFDSIINGTIEEAENIFRKNNYKVLFSKDTPGKLYLLKKSVFPECKDNNVANAGLYMGYVKYLKIILSDMLNKKCKDDQVNINNSCKNYDYIEIDNNNEIFLNALSETDEKAIFIQYPGTINIHRVWRSFFEYGQFFLKYFIILYLIMVYFLYKYKKVYHIILLTIFFIVYYVSMDKSCIL
tara:strand:+ start:1421 stop:2158 length:738 start_codon:yes stop_codon:yes gene_type:complete